MVVVLLAWKSHPVAIRQQQQHWPEQLGKVVVALVGSRAQLGAVRQQQQQEGLALAMAVTVVQVA
jgi:hypothetical protein